MRRVTVNRAGGSPPGGADGRSSQSAAAQSAAQSAALADRLGINPAFSWMWGREPEHPATVDHYGVVHVLGFAESVAVLQDPKTFSNDVAKLMMGEVDEKYHEGTLLQADPPEHMKLRKIISRAFTPKMIANLDRNIADITNELLDAVEDRGTLELVGDLTYPMPVIVISDLLGVPRSDRDLFRAWVDKMARSAVALTNGNYDGAEDIDPMAAMRVVPEMFEYLHEHAAERRRKPREDLLTRLVEAEVDGERLSDGAVVNFANELLVVGHVTTSALLGNTMVCLDAHPADMDRVRADPTLTASMIEESLRYMSPIVISYKAALRHTEIAGVPVEPDQLVAVCLSAANRDPRQFPDPHRFDITRDPNPHLAFGKGIHFCLGAPLARMEGKIAIDILLRRFPKLRTDPDDRPEFIPLPHAISTSRLPLRTD